MKKKFAGWLAVTAAVMLLLPWLAVTFAKAGAGMAVLLLLFFAIDPVYSLAAGFIAGRNLKGMWSLPVINAAMFLLGAWIFFEMGESAFMIYAGIYLALGLAAMLVSRLICRKRK